MYAKGALLQAVASTGSATVSIQNITYNPRGQREDIYYGNNTKTKYYYNTLNFRITRILTTRNSGQDVLQDLNYTYDSVGNIVGQTDNAQQTFYFNNQVVTPTGTYTYDALYRLLTATGREQTALAMPNDADFVNNIPCPDTETTAMQNYTHNYQYDELGNILQMQSVGNWTRNYVYNNPMTNNYLLGHGGETVYSYDAHGNMLTMPHLTSMAWDYLDQLHSAANGTFTSYYNYDAEGKRSRKVVVKGNIREERYYIGDYEVYRKYINNVIDTERTTLNINDDEKRFAIIDTLTVDGGQTITPVVTIRYQYDNHLGSACLELDENASIISYEEYHPFGTTSYRSGRSQTEVSLKRYKYCGKERDEETGLYYYGMRYYAAWICRFVSVDPLQFKYPHYTPYQYAGNKPISYIDLDGGEEKKKEQLPVKDGAEKIAQTALEFKNTYTTNKTEYSQGQRQFGKDVDYADCASFVFSVLKEAGYGNLFTAANTSSIIANIKKIEGVDNKKDAFTMTPHKGDIMMWGGHVAIVTNVTKNGVEFVGMGTHGVHQKTIQLTNGSIDMSNKSVVGTLNVYGHGGFLGFWSPEKANLPKTETNKIETTSTTIQTPSILTEREKTALSKIEAISPGKEPTRAEDWKYKTKAPIAKTIADILIYFGF